MLSRRQLVAGTVGMLSAPAATSGRELWSWTTREQADALLRDEALFTRTERPGLGAGWAFQVLRRYPGNATAKALLTRFAKGRFAWWNPWATCLGFGGETYGDELVRIELEAGAVLARFDDRTPPKEAPDPALAGFEFENGAPATGCSSFIGQGLFREVYVGAGVARWSLRTHEIAARLEGDIGYLSSVLREDRPVPQLCEWLRGLWSAGAEYEQRLAFGSEEYRPTRENLARLIATLQARLPR